MLYLAVILFICIFDQGTKFLARELLSDGSSVPVINNIFHFTLVNNTGAAFGILRDHPRLFVGIAICAIVFICWFLYKKGNELLKLEKTALCFVLGGIMGNLIDRIFHGYVIDFLDFRVWPVFNVADSFITIGMILMAVSIFSKEKKKGTN